MQASSMQTIALNQPSLFPVRSQYCSAKQNSIGGISLAPELWWGVQRGSAGAALSPRAAPGQRSRGLLAPRARWQRGRRSLGRWKEQRLCSLAPAHYYL